MKDIKETKLYKYAENWLIYGLGKESLNPIPEIKRLLNKAIKELKNER